MNSIIQVLGNRLHVQRVDHAPDGAERIIIPSMVENAMARREPVFQCRVLALGTGKQLAEKQPEIQVGSRLIVDNHMGTQKLPDGSELISALDVLAMVCPGELGA